MNESQERDEFIELFSKKRLPFQVEDHIRVKPLYGRSYVKKVMRTVVSFGSGNELAPNRAVSTELCIAPKGLTIPLDSVDRNHHSYRLVLNQGANAYSILESKCDFPFRLNGVWTDKAYIWKGDIVQFGSQKVQFGDEYSEGYESQRADQQHLGHRPKVASSILKSHLNILIEGETGTGKTYWAQQFHNESSKTGPFVHLNLSSLAPSLIESELFGHVKGSFTGADTSRTGALQQANHGTLFLDEIDSLPLDLQTKLLLFLDNQRFRPVGSNQEIEVKTRIIVASGQRLSNLVNAGKFRKDLFYRLASGACVRLPSLRENPQLIELQLAQVCSKKEVSIEPNLRDFYKSFAWPGNYRQLRCHLDKKILEQGPSLFYDESDERLMDSPGELSKLEQEENWTRPPTLKVIKTAYCQRVVNCLGGDIKRSAEVLGISRKTVTRIVQ